MAWGLRPLELDHPAEGCWKGRVRGATHPLRAARSLLQSCQSLSITPTEAGHSVCDGAEGSSQWLCVPRERATATDFTHEDPDKLRKLLKLCRTKPQSPAMTNPQFYPQTGISIFILFQRPVQIVPSSCQAKRTEAREAEL